MNVVQDTLPIPLAEFFARPLFCFLATASPDGPRVSPLWYGWEDEAVWTIADTETKS